MLNQLMRATHSVPHSAGGPTPSAFAAASAMSMTEEHQGPVSWLGSRIPLAAAGRANSIEELSTPAERALAALDRIIKGEQVSAERTLDRIINGEQVSAERTLTASSTGDK